MNLNIWSLVAAFLLLNSPLLSLSEKYMDWCTNVYPKNVKTGSVKECEEISKKVKEDDDVGKLGIIPNLPIIMGAYCFNNGSGICKAFAGRFEFYFNTFTDTVIGPAPQSQYVDQFGYHERVPVSYSISGSINYADRAINWAHQFARKTLENETISLLSSTSFNWCAYAKEDLWPYKSSFVDHKTKGKFNIYFHNRQSCIVNTQTSDAQHFNTRFLQRKSNLRIDIDMNPLIFAMEDNVAGNGQIRLVKNKRQHWYEVNFKVVEAPTPKLKYFVDMEDDESQPCKINGSVSTPILSRFAYRQFSDKCVTDFYAERVNKQAIKNARLVEPHCGLDQTEIADYPRPQKTEDRFRINEVDLHNIPRFPETTASFYGVNTTSDEDWSAFAKDGYTFTATTTIPISDTKVKVISLYSEYQVRTGEKSYDEDYPMPYLSIYEASYIKGPKGKELNGKWKLENRKENAQRVKSLNYVDDIAYLETCGTILVIFGPLYTELPKDQFSLDTMAPVDSILGLSLFEMTSAFYANSKYITIYFRSNYVRKYDYKCGAGHRGLVTATPQTEKYIARVGKDHYLVYGGTDMSLLPFNPSEEYLFHQLNIYKGSLDNPEAPDPRNYPLGDDAPALPAEESNNLFIYIIITIGVILIAAMCIICLITLRRRRRKRLHGAQSQLPGTARSSSTRSHASSQPSARSRLTSKPRSSAIGSRTLRSSMPASSKASNASTVRSRARLGSSAPRSHSSSLTRRSTASPRSSSAVSLKRHSGASSRSSARTPRSSAR